MKCAGEQEGVVSKPKENLIILFPLLAEVSHSARTVPNKYHYFYFTRLYSWYMKSGCGQIQETFTELCFAKQLSKFRL